MAVCVCALQMRVARLEQLEKELQEARGSQESQLQVTYTHTHTLAPPHCNLINQSNYKRRQLPGCFRVGGC